MNFWKINELQNFNYPENDLEPIKLKKNSGIAIAGGGHRCFLLSSGYIAGLQIKYSIKDIKYLSTISSASWFNFIYSYCNDIKFNNYIPPEKLYLNDIDKVNSKTFTSIVTGKETNALTISLLNLNRSLGLLVKNDMWSDVVIRNYFNKIKNNLVYALPAVKNINDKHKSIKYINVNNLYDKPYPIINGTVYRDVFIPLEFTPLYYGFPICNFENNNGYYIDPQYFLSNEFISPSIQATISSNIMSAVMNYGPKLISDLIDPTNVISKKWQIYEPINNIIIKTPLIDAALYDFSGILPLLRRKVKNILAFYTTDQEINSKDILDVSGTNTIASLFGVTFSNTNNFYGMPIDEFNKNYQVFSKENWDYFVKTINEKQALGLPSVCLLQTTTIKNDYLKVESYPVNILILLNAKSDNWFKSLPHETLDYINNIFPTFPLMNAAESYYSPILSNLLYNYAMWQILNSPEYDDFFNNIQ